MPAAESEASRRAITGQHRLRTVLLLSVTEIMEAKLVVIMLLVGVFLGREAQAFYNPSTGRWLNRDPIGERGGMNLSIFVNNSPVAQFDLLGKRCCLITYPPAPAGIGPGHSVLKCDNGAYVSAWPDGMHTEAEDTSHFRGITPQTTCSDCMDESKVKDWLNGPGRSFDFNLCTANCSDATTLAMQAGLAQPKPTCPCAPVKAGLMNCRYEVVDRISDAFLMTPGRAKRQLEELAKQGCQRFYCKLTCTPVAY